MWPHTIQSQLARSDIPPSPLTYAPCFQPGPISLREVGCVLYICSLRSLCLRPFLSITAHQYTFIFQGTVQLIFTVFHMLFCLLIFITHLLCAQIWPLGQAQTLFNAQLLGLVFGTRLQVMHLLFPIGFSGMFLLNRVYHCRNHCPPGKAEKHLPS